MCGEDIVNNCRKVAIVEENVIHRQSEVEKMATTSYKSDGKQRKELLFNLM
jgi:hypothetical protein